MYYCSSQISLVLGSGILSFLQQAACFVRIFLFNSSSSLWSPSHLSKSCYVLYWEYIIFGTCITLQNFNLCLTFHLDIFPTKTYSFFSEEIGCLSSVSTAARPRASFQTDELKPDPPLGILLILNVLSYFTKNIFNIILYLTFKFP